MTSVYYNNGLSDNQLSLPIRLVLGLGNVGRRYENSRHNLGFKVVQRLLREYRLELEPTTELYDWAVRRISGAKIIFAMPKTYMNLSGRAARVLLQEYQLEPSQMLVVVDDYNLPLGKLRLRKSGSDGGHNGLLSIIEELGTGDYPRLRLGVGPVPEETGSVDFVLGDFGKEEIEQADRMIMRASEAVALSLEGSLDEAMTKYNVNPA